MRVAELSAMLHEVADRPAFRNGHATGEVYTRIESLLRPYYELTLETFADLLGKVKVPKPKAPPKPKVPPKPKAPPKAKVSPEEKAAKAEAAAAERLRKAEERARADEAKRAEKARKDAEKARLPDLPLEAQQAALDAAVALQSLLRSFRGGGVPQEVVEAGLARLQKLDKLVLLHVAKLVRADAGLTPKLSKPAILKEFRSFVMLVWKTSDNVNH